MQNRVPSQRPVRDFTPVPRKYRHDGWTAERQRAFVAALAETGSVKAAAHRINMSPEGAYYLRRQPGAEGFAAAWAEALDHGVQSLADIAIDRGREGVAVPVFWRGEQVGEKRRYNDRLLMFILRHHMPDRYGTQRPLRAPARAPGPEAAPPDPIRDKAEFDRIRRLYKGKIQEERAHRLAGNVIAADYALRQLTAIEVIAAISSTVAGFAEDAYKIYRGLCPEDETVAMNEMSQLLAGWRQERWDAWNDPPRPPLRLPGAAAQVTHPNAVRETDGTRAEAQSRARAMMIEAQTLWEAAATEESWAKWRGG